MTDVGPLQHRDIRVQVDRLTHRYRDALGFAKLLVGGRGTAIAHGGVHGWCFLLRTPDVIEEGFRAVLKRALQGRVRIEKVSVVPSGSTISLNPDLVFNGGAAVGDIKYKAMASDWNRPDLYQSVAFAAGFRSWASCVIGFTKEAIALLPAPVRVGDIAVQPFAWEATDATSPLPRRIHFAGP